MKELKLLFILGCISMLVACMPKKNVDKTSVQKEINQLLDSWHKAAADANFKNYFSALDSTSIFIGTDASENWTKEEFASFSKPYFDAGKAWEFHPLERNIYFNSNVNTAWFDELLQTWMGTCRGSGVLELSNNQWVLKHYVLSVTVPNDDIQKVIAAKKERDSLFLKSFKVKVAQ